jgi:DNA-binding protein HU-beta
LVSQGINNEEGQTWRRRLRRRPPSPSSTSPDIAEAQELSKKQAETILTDLVTMITNHLKKGERIRIVGLGILQVRKRAARMGRNPATGEAIQIKASKKVAFRAAKELKEAV